MAITWFRGRLDTEDIELADGLRAGHVIENEDGKRRWLELHDDSGYVGWVNINLTNGQIEFGEPAA